jgi:hypothetical protein
MKRTLILSKETADRAARLGALGEDIAPSYLQRAGFNAVRNLNDDQNNHPFADLIAEREGLTYIISVKTRNKFEARSGNLNSRYKLYSTPKHVRLIEHLAALHNATPAWLAIQIDGERLSIYFGTVEQLHGNKGIPMTQDCLPFYECLANHEVHELNYDSLRNVYKSRIPAHSNDQHALCASPAKNVFLHLCCEGWKQFGPFEWLSFQDNSRVIVDETGTVVTAWDGEAWRTFKPDFEGYSWENPTITIGPQHPRLNKGCHPNFTRQT